MATSLFRKNRPLPLERLFFFSVWSNYDVLGAPPEEVPNAIEIQSLRFVGV
jgi:hypothetical protein